MANKTSRTLVCDLKNDELLKYGSAMADTLHKIREAEESKKASADHWKDEISRLDKEASILMRKVSTRKEERSVECEWHYYWDTGLKELIRTDTFEIVEKGQISDSERQMHLEDEKRLEQEAEDRAEFQEQMKHDAAYDGEPLALPAPGVIDGEAEEVLEEGPDA